MRVGNNIKRSCPKFSLVSLRLRRFFSPNLGALQKKRSSSTLKATLSGQYHIGFLTNSHRQYHWGNYFCFLCKNRPQKCLKQGILHTLQANGGARAPPAPPGYASGWQSSKSRMNKNFCSGKMLHEARCDSGATRTLF